MRTAMRAGLMFCAVALLPLPAPGQVQFTTIDYPGADATYALGINPAGDIVGAFEDSSGYHGFVLRNGTFTAFDYPDAAWTEARGISPQGDVVGMYGLSDNTIHGFLLRDGVLSNIDVPGQPNTMPIKISPNGTIVGCYHVSTPAGATIVNTMYGFTRDANGTVTSYSLVRTMHNGVNPSGDIAGIYFDPAGPVYSYAIRSGVLTTFAVPGSVTTRAWDISPTGAIVGWNRDATGFHGFLFHRGAFTSVDVPGAASTQAFGINAEGQIVGYFTDSTGAHGFLRVAHE
ncbi:MAG TPA: hypothetical protein VK886_14815 [Vicinamibacterales bacterium]|nr:hypothetical protein [Vicinamibacterales bacterium]